MSKPATKPKPLSHFVVIDTSFPSHNRANVTHRFSVDGGIKGFSFDNGRLSIDGLANTLYLFTNEFEVKQVRNPQDDPS